MPTEFLSRTHTVTTDTGQLADVEHELRRSARLGVAETTTVGRGVKARTSTRAAVSLVASFTVTFEWGKAYGRPVKSPFTMDLYRDRGIRPQLVLDRILEEDGDVGEAFRQMVLERQEVEELGPVSRVRMTIVEPKPDTRVRQR